MHAAVLSGLYLSVSQPRAGKQLPARVDRSRPVRSGHRASAYNPPHERPDDGLPADAVDDLPARRTGLPRARRSSGASPTSRSSATPSPTSPAAPAASPSALLDLGVEPGDRVATLGWNHGPHLEAYFGIPLMGGVLHTLNLRLHPDELAYIVNHADDRVVLVDETLLPLWEQVRPKVNVADTSSSSARPKPVADGYLEYEALIAKPQPAARSARSRRARRRRDVLHDRHHRQAERRALLAPRARAPLASASRSIQLHGHRASATSCCRSCRCSTPTRGACRSPR